MPKLLLFGSGNPGHDNDTLGPLLLERVNQFNLAKIACLVDIQLLIEHASDLMGFDRIQSHIAAICAEYRINQSILGLVVDGIELGTDNTP